VHGLPSRHGDGVVEQDLVCDVRLRRYGGTDRKYSGMEVSAVAQIHEYVLLSGEVLLTGPSRAFAAHVAEGFGTAVDPDGHVMTADTGHGPRAFWEPGGGIVRTPRAKPRLALNGGGRPRPFARLGVQDCQLSRDACPNVIGQRVGF